MTMNLGLLNWILATGKMHIAYLVQRKWELRIGNLIKIFITFIKNISKELKDACLMRNNCRHIFCLKAPVFDLKLPRVL